METWLRGLYETYSDRILPVTASVAEEWGRLNARRPLNAADSLMAATAKVHGFVLVTRNTDDLHDTGTRLFNPFH